MVDIGILFDDRRFLESEFSRRLQTHLQFLTTDQNVLLNVPYHGADDGFTSYLRKHHDPEKYIGIELEVNQKYVGTTAMDKLIADISQGLKLTIDDMKESAGSITH